MALLDRVTGYATDDINTKICPHQLYGLMREFARGAVDRQYLIDTMNISLSDEADIDWLIAQHQAQPDATAKELWLQGMWGIMLLSEIGSPGYTDQASVVAKITSL